MSESFSEKARRTSPLTYTLVTLAILIGVFSVIGVVTWAVLLKASDQQPRGIEFLLMVGLLVGAMGSFAIIVAIVWFSSRIALMLERAETMDQRLALLAEQSISQSRRQAPTVDTSSDTKAMQQQLTRIHEVLLLPAEERARRFQAWQQKEIEQRLGDAERHVRSGNFRQARAELEKLGELLGYDHERVVKARTQLDAAAEAAQSNDLVSAQQRVKDLMGLGRFAEAEHIAQELANQYPNGAEPMGLLGHVRHERALFEKRHRQRMHDEIQQFVHQRKWQQAVVAARLFIQTFPTGPDTEALRSELETLLANADIQSRKQFEQHIKELITNKQYWDAVELARKLIAEHPLSPQAQALRDKLPKLEELAHQQSENNS